MTSELIKKAHIFTGGIGHVVVVSSFHSQVLELIVIRYLCSWHGFSSEFPGGLICLAGFLYHLLLHYASRCCSIPSSIITEHLFSLSNGKDNSIKNQIHQSL